jgi:hypothetical protein
MKGGAGGGGGSDGGAAGGGHPGDGGTQADAGLDTHGGRNGGAVAGAGDRGTAGGGGGIDASPLTLPGCLSDLLSACQLVTPCVSSTNAAGDISDVCFAAAVDSGVGARATFTQIPSTAGNSDCGAHFSSVTVSKADGSPCYSFEQHEPLQYDCSRLTWTWKDPTGRVVATGSVDRTVPTSSGYETMGRITCAGGGASATCTEPYSGDDCCALSPYGSPACPDGVNVASCSAGTCP